MLAPVISFFVSAGLSQRRARQLAVGLICLLVLLALWLAKLAYDRSVISRHDAGQAAATAQADRAADAQAATQRRADDTRLSAEAAALEKVTENVSSADPRTARRAYYECIRVQQAARKLGGITPAC